MTDPFGTEVLRTSVLDAWRGSPTRFREDANAEEDLRLGGYRDRLLVELAQNAADAAGAEPGVLRITLVDGELRAANTGAPLTAAGVAALASLRASSKESGVGQFGVGFAAVLAVTDEPRVVSTSGGVQFSASRTRAEVPELASERGGDVPVLRLVWPVTETVPDGFTTEVRLPLKVD
ncbi:sacsin N-terminal ATP-binding-like domain-containing protein, partial [Lentzea sp.]|uniref:sacsin N-terminal ATP-binding-like domain-containing protein n=1 Tax=Lentzea sp. TaxID=56099 RepID=UPI002F02F540